MDSHPGQPIKPTYHHCPQCNDHATTLQLAIGLIGDPSYLYCPNCSYREGDQPEKVDAKAHHTRGSDTPEEVAKSSEYRSSIEETYARAVGEVALLSIGTYNRRRNLDMSHEAALREVKMTGATFDGEKFGKPFEVHQTGAIRSCDADDVRFDLVPQIMLERVAKVMAKGAIKYGEYNWTKGFKWSSVLNHLARHLYLYLIGDTTEDHLAHMVCNLGFLMEYEVSHPELNDIPTRKT